MLDFVSIVTVTVTVIVVTQCPYALPNYQKVYQIKSKSGKEKEKAEEFKCNARVLFFDPLFPGDK